MAPPALYDQVPTSGRLAIVTGTSNTFSWKGLCQWIFFGRRTITCSFPWQNSCSKICLFGMLLGKSVVAKCWKQIKIKTTGLEAKKLCKIGNLIQELLLAFPSPNSGACEPWRILNNVSWDSIQQVVFNMKILATAASASGLSCLAWLRVLIYKELGTGWRFFCPFEKIRWLGEICQIWPKKNLAQIFEQSMLHYREPRFHAIWFVQKNLSAIIRSEVFIKVPQPIWKLMAIQEEMFHDSFQLLHLHGARTGCCNLSIYICSHFYTLCIQFRKIMDSFICHPLFFPSNPLLKTSL